MLMSVKLRLHQWVVSLFCIDCLFVKTLLIIVQWNLMVSMHFDVSLTQSSLRWVSMLMHSTPLWLSTTSLEVALLPWKLHFVIILVVIKARFICIFVCGFMLIYLGLYSSNTVYLCRFEFNLILQPGPS